MVGSLSCMGVVVLPLCRGLLEWLALYSNNFSFLKTGKAYSRSSASRGKANSWNVSMLKMPGSNSALRPRFSVKLHSRSALREGRRNSGRRVAKSRLPYVWQILGDQKNVEFEGGSY
jgi:hypothetical protein